MKFYLKLFSLLVSVQLVSSQTRVSNTTHSIDYKIISGATGNQSGTVSAAAGKEAVEGTVSIVVGQIVQTNDKPMTGTNQQVELGYWNIFKRRPEGIALKATYDFYPDRVILDWTYDANMPQATLSGDGHDVYRGVKRVRSKLSFSNSSYTDNENNSGLALTPGTEYTYTVKGSNVYGFDDIGDTYVGKTSSNGTVTGFVRTSLGTDIPFVRMAATPNWGSSLMLDGKDDYAFFTADSVFDMAANNSYDSLTTEIWFNTPDVDGTQVILNKGTAWKLAIKEVGSYNKLTYHQQGSEKMVSDDAISTDAWNHVSMVKTKIDNNSAIYRFYVNGSKILFNTGKDTLVAPLAAATNDPFLIGKDSDGNFFRGNIDEFRIWSKARNINLATRPSEIEDNVDSTGIKKYYNVYTPYRVAGKIVQPTLLHYNNMDVGAGKDITNAVNQSLKGQLAGESDLSYWHDSDAPAYATGFTDLKGAYNIVNVNYGIGTNVNVTPTKPFHVFSPPTNTTYLSDANPVRNNVDFKVTNLQSISGYVKYDPTNCRGKSCGVADVKILQNGTFLGTVTDQDGYYLVEVEPGGNMTVKPDMPDRDSTDYRPYSAAYENVVKPKSRDFIDMFKRDLEGTIAGGSCQLALGPDAFAKVIATSASGCFSDTVDLSASGNYIFKDMPIMAYNISIDVNTTRQYEPKVPNLLEIGTHFKNNGKTHDMQKSFDNADSTWGGARDTVDFTYYAPVAAKFTAGFSTNIVGDFSFKQNKSDTIDVSVYEGYYRDKSCPLTGGWVKVRDYVGDRYAGVESDTLKFNVDSLGNIRYPILPGVPNTSPDGAYGYKKKFEILASDSSEQRQATISNWAVVTGHKPVSVDFTTTAPDVPFLILRHPPGDGSSSTFTSESSSSFSLGFSLGASAGFEQESMISAGVSTTTMIAPMGIGTAFDIEAEASVTSTSSISGSVTAGHETTWEYTTSESYSTGGSDIYIGGAINILYGTTDILSLKENDNKEWDYNVKRDIIFLPDGFATTFQYSRSYIDGYLLPELKGLVLADPSKQKDVDRWNSILAYADNLAKEASYVDNKSFDGNAGSYTQTTSMSSTEALDFGIEMEIETSVALGVGIEVMGVGIGSTSTVSFGMNIGSSISSSKTNTTTVDFTLADDDAGDDYSVNIKTDKVYGTPVFEVVAGNSSCPYEEWTNSKGVVVTNPQDEPFMQFQSASTATNVLPDGTAEYRVLLRNESVSQSTRTYSLSVVKASNPRGAEILINGFSGVVPFTLDYLKTDTATVTVRRPQNSDFYEFKDLRIKFAPECETNYAGVTAGYQASFTANFARPCSEVNFYNISENWSVNKSFNDTLPITFHGYDLTQSYFDRIELQFSPLEETKWYSVPDALIITDSLRTDNRLFETTYWDLSTLSDGLYDLRFKSVCLDGAMVNLLPPLRGVIDRKNPVLLGGAEPVDKVLNQNDEIGFNFTEDLSPASISKINFEINDPYGVGKITAFDFSADANRVTADFTLANRDIENHNIDVKFFGFTDLYGNIGDTITHSFSVNRNPISWSMPELSTTAIIGKSTVQTVQLNNIGSNAKEFEITGLPDWLKVDTPEGTLNPGGNWEIDFTISADINVGDFVDTIFAETPEGNEPLAFKVAAMCDYPDWYIDPVSFEYNMNIVGKIAVLGTISEDKYDRVAAVVDGEYRGSADLIFDKDLKEYRAYLTIFSNVSSGEVVEFHIWDRSNCLEWWKTDQTVAFAADGSYGEPNEPLAINATGEVAQEFKFPDGWDWMSFNLEANDMSLEKVFGKLSPSFGDRIVGQSGFAQYSKATGWVGSLTQAPLNKREMFMVSLTIEDSTDFIGVRVGADTIPIHLNAGWNWISYLPNLNADLGLALKTLSPDKNDLIKSQTHFAQYVEDVGWVGNLKRLRPSEGYKIQMANSDTLTYPYLMSGQMAKKKTKEVELPLAPWDTVNWRTFKNSMTVIALIENKTDHNINDPMDVVVVIKNNEVRGFGRPEYIEGLNAYRLFMTVFSNEDTGESLELNFWDSDEDVIYAAMDNISFTTDDILGNVQDPWLLRLKPLTKWDNGFVPESYVLDQNYPNPFNPITRIGFGVPEDSFVSLKVYNIRGNEVRSLLSNQFMNAGYQSIVWNAKGENGNRVSSGVYFMVMNAGSFHQTKKMILLK
jgi:hypothetical protein